MITSNGGPAFPISLEIMRNCNEKNVQGKTLNELGAGMSLWDFFAAHALSNPYMKITTQNCEQIAIEATMIADALLIERAKRFSK